MSNLPILPPGSPGMCASAERWLARAEQARRIARVLGPADAEVAEAYAIECEVQALRKNEQGEVVKLQLGGTATHGNSGGPVVTTAGEVVGVLSELARELEGVQRDLQHAAGISYAIPSRFIEALSQQMPSGSASP